MSDKPTKILVVEDNPTLMKAEIFALEDAGFVVDMAKDGKEALRKIKKNKYAVIMLDLIMPRKTGFNVYKSFTCSKSPFQSSCLAICLKKLVKMKL